MNVLGIGIDGKDIFLFFCITEESRVASEKFTLSDSSGSSLRELYNYIQLYLKGKSKPDKIVIEAVSNGLRSPSIERVKAEGAIEMVLYDIGYESILTRIKTQKKKTKYKELVSSTKWVELKKIKYFSKADQIFAYLVLEGII
jgi:hypothetical protein